MLHPAKLKSNLSNDVNRQIRSVYSDLVSVDAHTAKNDDSFLMHRIIDYFVRPRHHITIIRSIIFVTAAKILSKCTSYHKFTKLLFFIGTTKHFSRDCVFIDRYLEKRVIASLPNTTYDLHSDFREIIHHISTKIEPENRILERKFAVLPFG